MRESVFPHLDNLCVRFRFDRYILRNDKKLRHILYEMRNMPGNPTRPAAPKVGTLPGSLARKKAPLRREGGAFVFREPEIYSDFSFRSLFFEPCRNLRKSLLAGSTRVVLSFRDRS